MPFFRRSRRGPTTPQAYGLLSGLGDAERTFDLVGVDE